MIAAAAGRHLGGPRHARRPSRWRVALRWALAGLALLGWIQTGHPVIVPPRYRRASRPGHRGG